MPEPIRMPAGTTISVNTPGAVRGALASVLAAMSKPDSVLMGLIRHGLTMAGGILVSKGFIDSSLADQLVGAGVILVGTGWSVAAKFVIEHWLKVAIQAPATTTRTELSGLVVAEANQSLDPKTLVVPLVLLLSMGLSGCNGVSLQPTGPSAAVVSTLVVGAVGVACNAVPVSDRAMVSQGLMMFLSLLNTDPVAAMKIVEDKDGLIDGQPINKNLGMSWIWAALHSQLDALGTSGWSVYGAQLLRGAVVACQDTIS